MSSSVEISIIVPIYNVDPYLYQCLESIVKQTKKNIEIILVNDASTDHSLHICEYFRKNDDRVIIINKKKNEGLVSARITGIQHSTGNYVMYVDADDWISIDYLKEIYVTTTDGVLCEKIDELSSPELENYFKELKIDLKEGQRAEVNLKALDWVENISCHLNRGFVITIDYGYLAEELYSEERCRGTLVCYFEHTTSENPYERVGNQDITSHVNFSSIIEAGIKSGLSTTGFVRQSNFLIALGILNKMNDAKGDFSKLLTMKNLFMPGGMGDMFKVLIQHKGVNSPELIGLRSMSEPGLAKEIEGC